MEEEEEEEEGVEGLGEGAGWADTPVEGGEKVDKRADCEEASEWRLIEVSVWGERVSEARRMDEFESLVDPIEGTGLDFRKSLFERIEMSELFAREIC